MVRVNAVPSECPLLRAYHVTYSNSSGCFCRSPTSYAHACSSASSFLFRLRQCRQCSNTFEQNMELECLATWKENSKYFGFGKFVTYIRKDEDEDGDDDDANKYVSSHYRCFMYHILGAVAYLSISNNSSCDPLKSAREGPLLFELTEDFFGWPGSPGCSFPTWLTSFVWFMVPNFHDIYEASDSNDTLVGRSTTNPLNKINRSFKCLRFLQTNATVQSTSTQVRLLTHAFNGCHASYRCLTITIKRRSILTLQIGQEMNTADRCLEQATPLETHILVASTDHEDGRCPLKGRYLSTSSTSVGSTCRLEMKIACGGGDRIELMDQCYPMKVERMICLSWWMDHGGIHLIAERTGINSVSCFAFQHLEDSLLVSHQEECFKHLDDLPIQQNTSSFIVQFKDKCRERASVRSNEQSMDPPSIIQSDDFQQPQAPVPQLIPTNYPIPQTSSSSQSLSTPGLLVATTVSLPRIFAGPLERTL